MTHRFSWIALGSLLSLAACAGSSTMSVTRLAEESAPSHKPLSRLRKSDGTSYIHSFATFYAIPDTPTMTLLAQRDLLIVQPNISDGMMRDLQANSYVVSYLAIGELGTTNTYYIDGVPTTGLAISQDRSKAAWFLGDNGNYQSKLLDLTRNDVRAFIVQQAKYLLGRGFDGLFLDTADDAEFFDKADRAGPTTQPFSAGAVRLDAGRPDYPTMRRAYIDIVKALRAQIGDALLVQNGGFDLLLDRQNSGHGTQRHVDAVMHETAVSKPNQPCSAPGCDHWQMQPQNYETWEANHHRVGDPQAKWDRDYRANRNALALEYFRDGGIVLQQDFGHPDNHPVQCASYIFAQELQEREHKDGWIAAYSDAQFYRLYDYVNSTDDIRAKNGCSTYRKAPEPAFAVHFEPPSANAAVGRTATATLNVAAVAGYSGSVFLSFGPMPPEVDARLNPPIVTPGPNARITVDLRAANTASPQTYVIPIFAKGQGTSKVYRLRFRTWPARGDSVFVAHAGLGKVIAFDGSVSLTPSTTPSRSFDSLPQAQGIALDARGYQYVVDNVAQGTLRTIPPFRVEDHVSTVVARNLSSPTGVTVDGSGRVWVVQSGSSTSSRTPRISRFDPGTTEEALGIDVPASLGVGMPNVVAVQGQTLWVTTSWGILLRYDVTTSPALTGTYTLPTKITGIGGISVQANRIWLAGTFGPEDPPKSGKYPIKNSVVVRLDPSKLPTSIEKSAVDALPAVDLTLTNGLFDPAGLGVDNLGNLWVINKTGAAGINNDKDPTSGSLVRFAAASLSGSNAHPDLTLDLGSRYPVGLAVGQP